ncbi:MAG: hypothetical protein WDN45_09025 [Caulobacteraceae bacterium]
MQQLPAPDGRGQRAERQTQREIPRPQDEAHPARLGNDLGPVVRIEGRRDLRRRHPLVEIVDVALDIAGDAQHLGDPDFPGGLSRVFLHRRDDVVGMRLHGGLQLRELRLALLRRRGFDVPLMRLLQGEDARDFLGDFRGVWRGADHGNFRL